MKLCFFSTLCSFRKVLSHLDSNAGIDPRLLLPLFLFLLQLTKPTGT